MGWNLNGNNTHTYERTPRKSVIFRYVRVLVVQMEQSVRCVCDCVFRQ